MTMTTYRIVFADTGEPIGNCNSYLEADMKARKLTKLGNSKLAIERVKTTYTKISVYKKGEMKCD